MILKALNVAGCQMCPSSVDVHRYISLKIKKRSKTIFECILLRHTDRIVELIVEAQIDVSTPSPRNSKKERRDLSTRYCDAHTLRKGTNISSLLYQQDMHRSVRNDDERAGKDGEANDISPDGKRVEAKGREDGGSGNFNVKTVFMVDEGEVFDFVDNKGFEAVVEYGKLYPIRLVWCTRL